MQDLLPSLILFAVIFLIFYFLILAPQQRQVKSHKAMLASLKKGDKIITNGGLVGEIIHVDEDFIKVELSDKVIVKLVREYVAKKIDEK